MSVSICWERSGRSPTLKHGGGSIFFIEAMNKAFHVPAPWHLDEHSLSTLRGMAAILSGRDIDNPYVELIELIETHGAITVWLEW